MTHVSDERAHAPRIAVTQQTLAVAIIVLIAPSNALGIAIAVIYAAVAAPNTKSLFPLILSLSLFCASFNSTKVPESDLYVYELASEGLTRLGFEQFIALYGHEPGYYFLNWVHVHILGFGWTSWVFLFTFLIYFSWLTGLRTLINFLNHDRISGMALILWAGFLPIVFFQSAHLVRQYLAIGFGLLGLSVFLTSGRGWYWLLAATLIHVTAVVLFILPIAVRLARRSRRMAILFVSLGPVALTFGGRLLGENIARLEALGMPSVISYGISRLSQNTFFQLDDVSSLALALAFMSLCVCIFAIVFRVSHRASSSTEVTSRLATFLAFGAVLSASTIALSLFGLNEPSTRLFQFVIMQLPFILCIVFIGSTTVRVATIATGLLMPFLFFVYPSAWSYGDAAEIVLLPYYFFLLQG